MSEHNVVGTLNEGESPEDAALRSLPSGESDPVKDTKPKPKKKSTKKK